MTEIHSRSDGARRSRLPRLLHPVAWWIWAISLAVAASQTTNPLLLLLIVVVLGLVVVSRRSDAPWARAFKYYIVVALTVVAIRVVFRSVFGGDSGSGSVHVLFRLPQIPLPSWAAGVQLGGPVTLEGTLGALYDGARLATLLCCLGAANVLANPKRVLRVLPGALYELGVATTVAFTVAPQMIESVQRVRRARRLRGGTGRGVAAFRSVIVPVMEDALERSLHLAAAMDSRGYGRTSGARRSARRLTSGLMLTGLAGLCLGVFGVLDTSIPRLLGVPVLVVGVVLCGCGLVVGGRGVRRTRYRPDPWRLPEWIVMLAGQVPAVVVSLAAGLSLAGLNPSTQPLAWPALPLVPALAVVVAVLPAVVAPPPVRALRVDPTSPSRHDVLTASSGGRNVLPAGRPT